MTDNNTVVAPLATKPKAYALGKDGNVFNVMAICRRALVDAGQAEKGNEMIERVQTEAQNYYHALSIMMDYVDIV